MGRFVFKLPDVGEGTGGAVPAGKRRLRRLDLLRAHASEEVVAGVVLADMFEAQPLPLPRTIEGRCAERRLELAGLGASGHCATGSCAFYPAVKSGGS